MTDENETNVNGETDKSVQIPLSKSICCRTSIRCVILEMLVDISPNSTIENQIYSVIRQNFLEQRSITWKPIKVELIVNTQLTDDFFGKDLLVFIFHLRIIQKIVRHFARIRKKNQPKKSIFLVSQSWQINLRNWSVNKNTHIYIFI